MITLKVKLLFLFIVLIPILTFSQNEISKNDISNWIFFSPNAPQFKKIDQERFFAFYRTLPNDAGLMVFDKKLSVLKNINIKLTKNKEVFINGKYIAELMTNQKYYYQKENNSIVLFGYQKLTKNDYAIVGLTYNLDSESLEKIDTLKIVTSGSFNIMPSNDDKHFLIYGKLEPEKKVKGIKEFTYEIFNQNCEKLYGEKINNLNDEDTYIRVNENGEFQFFEISENKKITSFRTTKYDNKGKLIGNATFSTPKDDIYEYESGGFISTSNQDFYVLCKKHKQIMEGIVILKLDYANQRIQKIADYKITEDILAKTYQSADPSHSMIINKKIKVLDELSYFNIDKVFCDSAGFYIITNGQYVNTYDINANKKINTYNPNTKSFNSKYSSEKLESKHTSLDIIVWHFGFNGKLIWTIPIIKSSVCYSWNTNIYTPDATGIISNYFMDENYVYMLISSNNQLFATKINKQTGKDIIPIVVLKENVYYMNKNLVFFNDANNVIIATMGGIDNFLAKKSVILHSMEIKY